MGDTRKSPARQRAIDAVVEAWAPRYREDSTVPGIVADVVDAIPTDVLQELHDERVLADLDDAVHISQLLEAEERRLRNREGIARLERLRRDLKVASEGRGGDPFAGFPKDGQP
jgi:hypothetical protein